ncbi:unnamed protein product [Ectocarpus sp. 12 AP-2014]
MAEGAAAERSSDCLSCRIIGAATMLGVSGYGILTRAQTPVAQRGHRAFLLGVSGVFAVAGIARAAWSDGDQVDDHRTNTASTNGKADSR